MSEKTVKVRFLHPVTGDAWETVLPADTRFDALDKLLYAAAFLKPQRPGYAYLAAGHLCPGRHVLADYLPEGAETLTLRVFDMPMVI